MAEPDDIRLCACGCGEPAPRNRKYRFIQRHYFARPRRRGPKTGYAGKTNGPAHRLRAEAALGKPLPKDAQVHHPDEDPWNRDARLVICQDAEYHKLLHVRKRVLKAGGNPNTDKICCHCHRVLPRTCFMKRSARPDGLDITCRECLRERTSRKRRTPEYRQKHQANRARRRTLGLDPN